jgi:thioredoxin 1
MEISMDWPDGIVEINDEGFEDFTKNHKSVLVDFWGPACAPCKMIAPVLEQLSTEMKGKVAIAKMDVTKNMKTPMKLGIRSIPTLAFYKDGKLVKTRMGFLPKPRLIQELNEVM